MLFLECATNFCYKTIQYRLIVKLTVLFVATTSSSISSSSSAPVPVPLVCECPPPHAGGEVDARVKL